MSDRFTGEESIADVLKVVLEEYTPIQFPTGSKANAEIIYQDNLPFLKFQAVVKDRMGEFVCYYRLDEMLATVFPECERLAEEASARGLFDNTEKMGTEKSARHLAQYAMDIMLHPHAASTDHVR